MSSIGFATGSTRSSLIVSVAVGNEPKTAPPVRLDSVKGKVSGPSTKLSCEIKTRNVLTVSPGANRKVPSAVVKSQRGKATPPGVEQGSTTSAALSSGVV